MKTFIMFFFLFLGHQMMAQPFFDQADLFFNTYVEDGLVKYEGIKNNPKTLNQLVAQIAAFPLDASKPESKKAFLIDAYNLLVIKQIIDNYPVEGPLKLKGFFDEKKYQVAGSLMTLNQLEKEQLMKSFPDARLHFVLVCAAMGCPPLASSAYRPEGLENQLNDRTKFILNFDPFIRVISNKVTVSKIFEWYQADFTKGGLTIPGYIDQYRSIKIGKKPWTFYEYDWSLNKK